ncbi:MAG: NAD(P)-binding protein [Acidimicrobiales bacterium]
MTAAAVAARAGARVALVEPHRAGGRARSETRDGFTLNLGPHALYRGGAAERVLDALGVAVHGGYPADLRGQRLLVDGRSEQAPVSPATLLRSGAVGWRGRVALGRVLNAAQRAEPAALADVSVAAWFDRFGLDGTPRARRGVRAVDDLCRRPRPAERRGLRDPAPAGRRALPRRRLADDGRRAGRRRRAAGVVARTANVAAVRHDGDELVVQTAAGDLRAASVVLAVGGPEAAARLAGLSDAWVASAGPASAMACLDLGLRRALPGPWFLHGVDEPLYFAQQAPPAGLAPDGGGVAAVGRYLAPGERPEAAATRAQLLAHAARAGVEPDNVGVERYLHHMVTAHGMPLAARGGFAGRPAVAVPGRPGLFVAGDYVGGEGLLADAAFASGERAGRLAAAHRVAVAA